MWTARPGTAHTLADWISHGGLLTVLVPGARVRLPFFCIDFFHDLDFEVTLGKQFLQPGILPFEFLQSRRIRWFHAAIFAPPAIEGCLANRMFATQLLDRQLSSFRFAQNGDD